MEIIIKNIDGTIEQFICKEFYFLKAVVTFFFDDGKKRYYLLQNIEEVHFKKIRW